MNAVVLLSGGLDSATTLAIARNDGCACYALSFRYGQRQTIELQAAAKVAHALGAVDHKVFDLDLGAFGGSALTDTTIDVPKGDSASTAGIPVTYVPARNTVFLSIAMAWAETLQAGAIYLGINAVDYSGYPDCRPEFVQAFENLAQVATKAGVEGHALQVRAPLIEMSKAQIIQAGTKLNVPYDLTHSCYDPQDGLACGRCDACHLRREGFMSAGVADPTRYV